MQTTWKTVGIGCVLGMLVQINASAEPFLLRHDETGNVYGPFESTAGATVVIEGARFTVVKPQPTASERVKTKLASIIIPEIEFREATVSDVLNFLRTASREYDPSNEPEGMRGVNLIPTFKASDEMPRITFRAKQISLEEALKVVTQVAELAYRVEGNLIMIEPKKD